MAMDPHVNQREYDKFVQTPAPGLNTAIRVQASFGDSVANDAFGRLRVSNTGQRLDVEFLYDLQPEYFDQITNNGTVTHNDNPRDLTLALDDANNGSYARMSSYPVPYTPANSQLIEMTGVLNLAAIGGGTVSVFVRTKTSGAVVEQTFSQSTWDNLTTSADIDFTKSQLFSIDFQSVKVGRIRFGIFQSGIYIPIKSVTHDNSVNVGQWQLANLPVSYSIRTTAGTTYLEIGYFNDDNGCGFRYEISANASATLKAICCTVKSEDGPTLQDMPGLPRSVDRGITPYTVSTTLVPLISIRPRSTFQSVDNLILSIPKGYTIQTNEAIRVAIVHGGTLTNASWTAVDTNRSSIEYDVAATAITNGHENSSEYIYATSTGPAATRQIESGGGLLGKTILWNRQDANETGIISLCAIRTGASDASVLAGINWEELR